MLEQTSAAVERFSTRHSPEAKRETRAILWEIDLSPGVRKTPLKLTVKLLFGAKWDGGQMVDPSKLR
jgi:hypothetical protein